jgi:4'-phosphopantetheinyl transferase
MFEVAHALVRQGLSVYADVPASDWSFATNQWGRPEVVGPAQAPRFTFSLSHTRGLVACAISEGVECGVDVESFARGGRPLRVARRVLSEREFADLEAQPAEAKLGRLLEYWTLKEAYLKARGVGMSVAMRDVSFALDERGIRLVAVDREATSDPTAWSFTTERPTPSHTLALAVGPPDGPSRSIVMRKGLPRDVER